MIKNKDGSYNKVSLIILSLITIIGIGIIISSIVQLNTNELPPIIIFGLLVGISGLFVYRFIIKRTINKNHTTFIQSTPQKTIPITKKPITSESTPIPILPSDIKNQSHSQYKSTSGINLISILITFIVAAVTIVVGMNIMNTLQSAMPSLPEGSTFATQQTALNSTISSAFTIIPLFFLIGTVGFVISILFKFTMDDDRY